jgi:hypothetical protein
MVDVTSSSFTMEHLFSPCTRYRDIAESEGRLRLEELTGYPKELNLDVSTEEFLSAERAFTFAGLYAVLGNEDTVAWLTPHASVMRAHGLAENFCKHLEGGVYLIRFNIDGKQVAIFARSSEAITEVLDVVLRLLAASVVHSVILNQLRSADYEWIDSATLKYLMEQCQSLKALTLEKLALGENQCRVLGAYSRPDLEIELTLCRITGAAATVLAEVLGHNQGPTKLDRCTIDNVVLVDGLRGNCRLESLILRLSNNLEVVDREVLAIAGALRENKGLVNLNLCYVIAAASDETWNVVCDSLKTHPTLQVLNLRRAKGAPSAPARLKSRIQVILDMMKINMSIHTIHLHDRYSQHELFREKVIPFLETNRLRPRVRAIQKTRPILYRAKVLGRALLAVRTDPNRFWILLSGNAEVAFPSPSTTIAAATNLPTPPTAAVTVTDTDTTTLATSVTGASAVDIAVASASGQKRKPRP